MSNPFEAALITIRAELQAALARAWSQLAEPGAWLNGAQRAAVATETRHAWNCGLCHERKAALSPYAVVGEHDDLGELPKTWIDVIHRVTTDSGRLTQRWVDESTAGGVLEDELVEIISVSIITTTIDAFAAGIGMDVVGLPTVQPGMPPRRHYQAATPGPGWISTTAPENAGPELTDLRRLTRFTATAKSDPIRMTVRHFWRLANQRQPWVPPTNGTSWKGSPRTAI